MKRFRLGSGLFCLVGVALVCSQITAAASVYVGLGDSITFGETDLSYVPSYGDRGYVSKFADVLATRNGGTRPEVVNFAIDGETASSFMTGVGRTPPVVGRTDTILAQQNLNYTGMPTTPQATMFSNLVASENAAGNTIDTISITLGFNEVAALATLPESQALAMLPATLAAYQANYTAVLTQIRSLEPMAELYMLGYFNPFPGDPTANPAKPIFAQAGPELNGIIQALANQFDAHYVDTATPYLGHEAAYTYIGAYPAGAVSPGVDPGVEPIGNVHPNDTGYTVIANQLAAVPEPSSLSLVGLFAITAGGYWRLRRRS